MTEVRPYRETAGRMYDVVFEYQERAAGVLMQTGTGRRHGPDVAYDVISLGDCGIHMTG